MAEFDVKVGGFKGHADLDFNPKNIFMSIGDKIDEETTGDIAKFYRQYETPLAGLLGLGKLAAGKSIDPPLYERGPHSFGIRDLNLEDWPTGVYGYNTDDFNLEAEAGPQGDGWMAGLRGTYNFAEGGFTGDRGRWNPDYREPMVRDAAWIEGRDWYRGPSGEQIPIFRGPPRDQPIHPEKIKHLQSINDREYAPFDPNFVPLPGPDVIPGFGDRARPLPSPDMLPEDGGETLRGGRLEGAYAIGINDNLIPQGNTSIGANTGSPAPSVRTPQQPPRRGPTSSNPRNPYISSVANHPLVSEPTIPFPGGGLSSLDRVGWGHF